MDLSGFKEIVKDLTQGAEARAVSKALKLYAKGQLDRAIEVLKEAHGTSPENADILFELARLQTLAGHGPQAAEALRTVLRRNPRAYQRASEMIEELKAARGNVGPLYDAVAEHFIRRDDLKSAFEALEHIREEELRSLLPRHRGRWEALRKSAPDARMAKPSLLAAYYLALGQEVLKEYGEAAEIYRLVAQQNPEEMERVLKRLEGLMARDYHNIALRLAVSDLYLQAGREQEAAQQLTLSLETEPRSAGPVVEKLVAYLGATGERPELRWVLVLAWLAADNAEEALAAIRPLIDSGEFLDRVVATLQPLAATDRGKPARRLLAAAFTRRDQPQQALEVLLQVAEDEGLASIRDALQEIAAAHPELPRVQHLLADIHLAEGRPDEAVAGMRRARDLVPGEASVLLPKLTRLLEAQPAAADAHLLLADLLMTRDDPLDLRRAVVVLRHLVRVAPLRAGEALERLAVLLRDREATAPRARLGAAEACREMGRHAEALEHLRSLSVAHPEMTAEFLRLMVLVVESSPNLCQAVIDMLRDLEGRSPLALAVRFAQGEVAFHGGEPAASVAAYRAVLDSAPDRADEVRAALERFDRADPRAAEARYLLATLYLDRRDHAAAMRELAHDGAVNGALLDRVLAKYEEILQAQPDDQGARAGFVQALLLGRRFDRVLSVGQEALKQSDAQATIAITLAMGDALRETGDSDGAVKRYFAAYGRDRSVAAEVIARLKSLVEGEGTQALGSLALGKVLAAEKRPAEAVEALRAASAVDPKLQETVTKELQALIESCPADPLPGLAMLSFVRDTGDLPRAVKVASGLLDAHPDLGSVLVGHLEAILEADPKLSFAHYELARALQHLRMHPRAAATYLTAARSDATLAPMVLKRLQEMILAEPSCPDPYLAACALHASRGKFAAAAETIQKALLRAPAEAARMLPRLEEIWKQNRGNPQIAMAYAEACRRAGRFDAALTAYGDAAQKDSSLFDAAFEGFEVIVRERPELGDAYLARGKAHTRRQRYDAALADFDRAWHLSPDLLHHVIEEVEATRQRIPDSYPCAMLIADLYIAAGRGQEAGRLLKDELAGGRGGEERLSILVRLWRLAVTAGDDETARHLLDEATALAPDRGQFLRRVHRVHVEGIRGEAALLSDQLLQGSRRGADLQIALRALVDLGSLDEARELLERHGDALEPEDSARLRGEIALREGDYARAASLLESLGPSRILAFGAERSGNLTLAARILEILMRERDDPALRVALDRVYRSMVTSDLMCRGPLLQGETLVTFDDREGAAA